MLVQIIVVGREAGRRHTIALEQVEARWLPPDIETKSVVRAAFERPTSSEKRIAVEVGVVLATELQEFARVRVRYLVRPFLELLVAPSSAGKVDRGRAATNLHRPGSIEIDVTREPPFCSRRYIPVDPSLLGKDDVQDLALPRIIG